MSITDELRAVAAKTECANGRCEKLYRGDLDRIADRIDAEHERQMADAFETRNSDENLEADGWMRLPKDADGEPIHVGDVMENLREDLEPKLHHRFKVYSIQYRDYGQVCTLTEDGYPSILYRANECRHYHAPTVEDVLEELLREYDRDDSELTNGEIIERFAAKLRLADE